MFKYWNATALEVVEYVRQKLLEQGRPALQNGLCVYMAPDGSKCAAGHLIPGDAWCCVDSVLVGGGWDRLLRDIGEHILPSTHRSLIKHLQEIHDIWLIENDGPWNEYINKHFDVIAKDYS